MKPTMPVTHLANSRSPQLTTPARPTWEQPA